MSERMRAASAAALLILLAGSAGAQTPSPDGGAEPGAQDLCRTESGMLEPCDTLSEQLGETGGIIEPPPAGDPEIAVPPPEPAPNTTPVIPPGALPDQQVPEGRVMEQ